MKSESGGIFDGHQGMGSASNRPIHKPAECKSAEFLLTSQGRSSHRVDSFTHPWDYRLCYAFPPFQLITLVLRKFREESTDLILVTPCWPKRPWSAMLLNLATKHPWKLPSRKDLLTQGALSHPERNPQQLTAWFLRRIS